MNEDRIPHKNPLSFQLDLQRFEPATKSEKEEHIVMRESVTYWQDAMKRFRRNPIAMGSMIVILFIIVFAFIVPMFYPYSYEQQIRGSENVRPMQYSAGELERIESGEKILIHVLGTDSLGRDMMVRIMYGTRISLLVGLIASGIILVLGSVYGAVSGYAGGNTDMVMMRIVDIIYTIPDILIIILLMVTIREPLKYLFENYAVFRPFNTLGTGLISIFIAFSLLYWVGMARMVRGQILALKELEYVTAARASGASHSRIIFKHLIPNCLGTIIVTTSLQIPSSIFVESFLSFLGLGVSAPMPSLGSLAANAIGGINSYPYRLLAPAIAISIVILAFNLFGDGLRDAFDPKMKK